MNDARAKIDRVCAALEHTEPDRVPVGEFFWTNFIRRARQEGHIGDDFDPYRYWDLDLIVISPNMDPHVKGIEVLEDSDERMVVKTGFETTIELRSSCPMPLYRDFETKTYEQMQDFRFDDPRDGRRYLSSMDDQINSVAKLNAAKGGGYIVQSDHSIPENVDFASYDYMVQLIREYGNYPLELGEFEKSV